MNLSKIAVDNVGLEQEEEADFSPMLRERRQDLAEVIGALEAVNGSAHWKVLQDKVFQGAQDILQRKLRTEKDSKEVLRLQGQIVWMEKYLDLGKLIKFYRKDLQNVDKQLNA